MSQGVCIEHPTNNQKILAPSPGRCGAASCNRCRTASNGHPCWVSSYAAINEGVIASVCWRLSLCLGNILTNVYVKWCHKYVTYMLQCPYKYKHNMQGFKRKTPNWPTLIYDSMYIILTEVLLIIQVAYPSLYLATYVWGWAPQPLKTRRFQLVVNKLRSMNINKPRWNGSTVPKEWHLLYHVYTTVYMYACLHIYIYMYREKVLSYIYYLHVNIYIYVLCMSMCTSIYTVDFRAITGLFMCYNVLGYVRGHVYCKLI